MPDAVVRVSAVTLVAAAALAVAIPSAEASSVKVSVNSDTAIFHARRGEKNALVVPYPAQSMTVTDNGAALMSVPGAFPLAETPPTAVSTKASKRAFSTKMTPRTWLGGPHRIWAGSGDDTVIADSFGQHAEVYGGSGRDDIDAEGEGGQIASGGPGDDIVTSLLSGDSPLASAGPATTPSSMAT